MLQPKDCLGGGRIAHYTINDAKLIAEYLKSISVEEDAKRLALLHNTLENCGMTAEQAKKQVGKDIYKAK